MTTRLTHIVTVIRTAELQRSADETRVSRLAQLRAPRDSRQPLALVLADGTRVRFRPIGPDDRDNLAALFARLSPESRRRRFLSPKNELTSRELAYLTDIDHVTHEAIAAVDERDGSIVGVGRYAQFANRAGVADVAIAVADDLQGMGVGTALARHTGQRARDNGFTLLTASTLWENGPARALLRRFGFCARASHAGEIELELKLAHRRGGPKATRRLAQPTAGTARTTRGHMTPTAHDQPNDMPTRTTN